MNHEINVALPHGSYRIICRKCNSVFAENYGDISKGAIEALSYDEICPDCGSKVVLETNPEQIPNRYDANHPYPDFI